MRTTMKVMGILVWALGVAGCGSVDPSSGSNQALKGAGTSDDSGNKSAPGTSTDPTTGKDPSKDPGKPEPGCGNPSIPSDPPSDCSAGITACYENAKLTCAKGIDDKSCQALIADCDVQSQKCAPPTTDPAPTCQDEVESCYEKAKLSCTDDKECQALVAQCQELQQKCTTGNPKLDPTTDPKLDPTIGTKPATQPAK